MANNSILVCIIVCLLVVMLPLTIAQIVVGATRPGICDNLDIMGLTVGQYLLGSGVSGVLLTITMVALSVAIFKEQKIIFVFFIIIIIAFLLFSIAYFIVGGVILFRSNLECIRVGSSHVIFGLVLWCFTAFQICATCRTLKFTIESKA